MRNSCLTDSEEDALARVNATEGELAVERGLLGAWLVEDADGVVVYRTLREEVVGHGGHGWGARDGALCEVNGPDAQDAVDAIEALSGRGDTDALFLDHELGAERDRIGVCCGATSAMRIRGVGVGRMHAHSVPEKVPEP